MKTAKLGAMFLVAVLAITAIGASYAHWEETLTISGIMTTDDIDVGFYCEDSNDKQVENLMDPVDCGEWIDYSWVGDRRDKNVGYMDVLVPADDDNLLKITIGDAYPCYYSHAFWCIKNYGSCPVLIHSVKLTELSFKYTMEDGTVIDEVFDVDIDLDQVGTWYFFAFEEDGSDYSYVVGTPADPENYDYSFYLTHTWDIDTQIDPADWAGYVSDHMANPNDYTDQLEQDLCIHFENGCLEEATYDFTMELVFYNWPHYVGTPPWAAP